LRLTLHEHPNGVETDAGPRVTYDLERDEAWFGPARTTGHALVWELGGDEATAALAAEVELAAERDWIVRCDRIDFPPGGVAYRHVHPGPGIRRLLHGALTLDADRAERTIQPGEAWFEGSGYPVLATASESEDTAFVRVLLLPQEWAGRRTIRYLDPADEAKPKRQRATVLLEEALAL
jgi:quercetin dioxygenase-like cupin family protein